VKLSLIVCPVEFSASGKVALGQALSLAQWHGAELHVLYVQRGRVRRDISTTTSTADPVHRRLEDFVSSLKPEGVDVAPVVLSGDPAKNVAEYARMKAADLLVVGQHGRRGTRFRSSGVLANDLARDVPCPTLTVPAEPVSDAQVDPSFRNIVCAIDFSPASRQALNKALTLAQESAGRLTLLHVIEGFPYESVYSGSRAFRLVGEYRARVEKITRDLHALVPPAALNWCDVETQVVSGIPHGAILAVATTRRADLVVLGLPPRTRLERIVMSSTAAGVLRRVSCPVLTVPGPSRAAETISKSARGHEDGGRIGAMASSSVHSLDGSTTTHSREGLS
jgi:nucleotide-binding universal stress UspA family protein